MPFGSQHRNERISAIALELSKGEYDIAILQEVWLVTVLFCSCYLNLYYFLRLLLIRLNCYLKWFF